MIFPFSSKSQHFKGFKIELNLLDDQIMVYVFFFRQEVICLFFMCGVVCFPSLFAKSFY